MTRLIPYPLFSLCLLAIWLLINATLAPAHILLGLALGLIGGLILARLQPPAGRVHLRAAALARLLWVFFLDIVRSNVAVLRIVFHPAIRGRASGFVSLPLKLRHPGGLAILACIITATPGTSWARYDAASNILTIHVLDLVDEQAWIARLRERYERRLMEIFE
jgi:multicomponent K+:H+ antiporter subunit E